MDAREQRQLSEDKRREMRVLSTQGSRGAHADSVVIKSELFISNTFVALKMSGPVVACLFESALG